MFNIIDILILLLLLGSIYSGWRRGFVIGLLDLLRWVGSVLLGLQFYPYVAKWLSQIVDWDGMWVLPVSFLLVTMLASILIQSLGSLLLRQLPAEVHQQPVNKAFGVLPGLVGGLVTVVFIALLLRALPLPEPMEERVADSSLVHRFTGFSENIEETLAPILDEANERAVENLTVKPGSDEFVELPYKITEFKPRPDLEQEMLDMLNKERVEQGLKPLEMDTALTTVARQHAADMFSRGYFSHYSPEGHDAFDRIRSANVPFRAAGENLAMAPNLTIAHEGLMNSPGHRANILHERFGRVGIGVLEGGFRRLMITQNFRN